MPQVVTCNACEKKFRLEARHVYAFRCSACGARVKMSEQGKPPVPRVEGPLVLTDYSEIVNRVTAARPWLWAAAGAGGLGVVGAATRFIVLVGAGELAASALVLAMIVGIAIPTWYLVLFTRRVGLLRKSRAMNAFLATALAHGAYWRAVALSSLAVVGAALALQM